MDIDIAITKMKQAHSQNNYEQSLKIAESLLADESLLNHKQKFEALLHQGHALKALNRYDDAITVFNTLNNSHPKRPKGMQGLYQTYNGLKDWEKVLSLAAETQDRFPNFFPGYVWQATAYLKLNRLDLAESEYQDILQRFPSKHHGLEGLIKVSNRLKDFNKVVDLTERFTTQNPNSWHGYWWKGQAYKNLEQYDEAKKQFDILKNKFPNQHQGLQGEIEIAQHQHDWQTVIELTKQFIEKYPTMCQGYWWQGQAHKNIGQYDEASIQFNLLNEKFPDLQIGVEGLIDISQHQRDWLKVIEQSKKFQDRFPEKWNSYWWIGEAYVMLKKYDLADKQLSLFKDRFPKQHRKNFHLPKRDSHRNKTLLKIIDRQQNYSFLFIGNSRNLLKPLTVWAKELEYKVELHRNNWEEFIDEYYPKISHINNSNVKSYATCQVVVNNQWKFIKELGVLSNRVFDSILQDNNSIPKPLKPGKHIFSDIVKIVTCKKELKVYLENVTNLSNKYINNTDLSSIIKQDDCLDNKINQLVCDTYKFTNFPPKYTSHKFSLGIERKLKIVLICIGGADNLNGSGYIRITSPITHEYMIDKLTVQGLYDDFRPEYLENSDICIVQRTVINSEKVATSLVDYVKNNNIKLIIDTDDAFRLVYRNPQTYLIYQHNDFILRKLMKAADVIWFSTSNLASEHKEIPTKKMIIPNALDSRIWKNKSSSADTKKFENEKVNFVYMGTGTHNQDFYEVIYPAFKKLNENYPDKFTLTLIGVVKDLPIESWINVIRVPNDERVYPRFVKWFKECCEINNFDVGLSPLYHSDFNSCKSDIKLLDYIGAGLLPMVSNVDAYNKVEGIDGIAVVVSNDSWYQSLELLLFDDISKLNSMIAKGNNYLWTKREVRNIAIKQYSCIKSLI